MSGPWSALPAPARRTHLRKGHGGLTAQAVSILGSYIYGFGRQQLNMSAGSDLKPEEIAPAFLQGIPADEYPHLREMVVEYAKKAGHDETADFEFGLSLILDGLQRLLDPVTS